jgi:GIY-YIG catalytic domain
MRQWHVYALKDPRGGCVRYVGITFNLDQRLKKHLTGRQNVRKTEWITSLSECGLVPEMMILESGCGGVSEQSDCERKWIKHFRSSGKLLNIQTPNFRVEFYFDEEPLPTPNLQLNLEPQIPFDPADDDARTMYMRNLFGKGSSLQKIANQLNAFQVKPPGNTKVWRERDVKTILLTYPATPKPPRIHTRLLKAA